MTIQDVGVDQLFTYFEDFDIDMFNALDDTTQLEDVEIKARVRRLNHKPFTFSITVESDHETTAAVRIMLGPKVDWFGQEIPINYKRLYTIEIDKFVAKRKAHPPRHEASSPKLMNSFRLDLEFIVHLKVTEHINFGPYQSIILLLEAQIQFYIYKAAPSENYLKPGEASGKLYAGL